MSSVSLFVELLSYTIHERQDFHRHDDLARITTCARPCEIDSTAWRGTFTRT